jgi:crotonobetainyl-CoA:carnitine CoA-transferase CaiB-like acyl-CoA transferase
MLREAEHRRLGSIKQVGSPFRMSSWDFEIRRAPPMKGEHTRDILREAGFDEHRIEELERSRVVLSGDGDSAGGAL